MFLYFNKTLKTQNNYMSDISCVICSLRLELKSY